MTKITEESMNKASKTLAVMLDYLGLDASIKTQDGGSKIAVIISSEDAGRIIGRKGKTLESLQMLLNRMLQKGDLEFPRVFIDIDGYSRSDSRGREGRDAGSERRRNDSSDRNRNNNSDNNRDNRRERRGNGEDEEKLRQKAFDAAKEVKRWGEPVTLTEMNAHDRRIIHVTLREEEEIHTESEGDGNLKKVVISLKG